MPSPPDLALDPNDAKLAAGTKPDGTPSSIALDADGQLLVGGSALPAGAATSALQGAGLPSAFTDGGGVKVGIVDALPSGTNTIGAVTGAAGTALATEDGVQSLRNPYGELRLETDALQYANFAAGLAAAKVTPNVTGSGAVVWDTTYRCARLSVGTAVGTAVILANTPGTYRTDDVSGLEVTFFVGPEQDAALFIEIGVIADHGLASLFRLTDGRVYIVIVHASLPGGEEAFEITDAVAAVDFAVGWHTISLRTAGEGGWWSELRIDGIVIFGGFAPPGPIVSAAWHETRIGVRVRSTATTPAGGSVYVRGFSFTTNKVPPISIATVTRPSVSVGTTQIGLFGVAPATTVNGVFCYQPAWPIELALVTEATSGMALYAYEVAPSAPDPFNGTGAWTAVPGTTLVANTTPSVLPADLVLPGAILRGIATLSNDLDLSAIYGPGRLALYVPPLVTASSRLVVVAARASGAAAQTTGVMSIGVQYTT